MRTISTFKFVLLYSIYSFALFNIPLFVKFISTLNPKSGSDFAMMIILIVVAFALTIVFYLLLFVSKLKKPLAILFLIINSLVFYFIITYNVPIDKGMVLNALFTDANEVRDLLSIKMFLTVILAAILPSILILFIKITPTKILTKTIFSVVTIIACLLMLFSVYFKLAPFFRVNRTMGDYLIPFNYVVPLVVIAKNKIVTKNEKEIIIEDLTLNSTQELNIVLVIGETARRKNFQIYGYERETSPELAKVKDLKILQNSISCGTSTSVSVPCIFQLKENYETFLKPIKNAGVFVKWYGNNYGGCYGMCDGVETFRSEHGKCDGSCPDGVIFDEFYKDLKTKQQTPGTKLFVLHQNGSHGPLYYKRYPKEFAKFQPECKTTAVNECNEQELINAYDNSILYTDYLIKQAIDELQKTGKPSILIYASDHGESLGENGIFLHGFPYAIAPKEQIEIPFLVWASFPIKIKERERYIHKNIIQSVLSLLKAESKTKNEELNIIVRQ